MHSSQSVATRSDGTIVDDPFVANFGMSNEQFRRELEAEFEQASPEERAEFERLVDEANTALPEMQASLRRMGEHIDSMTSAMGDLKASVASLELRVGKIEDAMVVESASMPLR